MAIKALLVPVFETGKGVLLQQTQWGSMSVFTGVRNRLVVGRARNIVIQRSVFILDP